MSSLNTKCLFQKLRKLEEKRVRYLSHLDNYRFYRLSRILPKGLKIKCSPSFGDLDPAFSKKWNDTLTKTSFYLLELLEAQCLKCIDKQSLDIESTEIQLKVACLNDHNVTISKPFYPPTLTTFVPPYNANRIRNVVMPRLTIINTSTDVSIRSPLNPLVTIPLIHQHIL